MLTNYRVDMWRQLNIVLAGFGVFMLHGNLAIAACSNPVNPDGTDPQVRVQVVGTWYTENQQMGMTQQMYQTFLPTGVFEYRDQTCSVPGMPCSQNYGHGVWSGVRQPDGLVYIRVQFSDMNRQNECTGWAASFPDQNTMAYSTGGGMRRVQ
jgi:hypothetical protein